MKKIFVFLIMMFSVSIFAGQRMVCPDLFSSNGDLKKWQVHGQLKSSEFSYVLISRNKVLGQNTIACKYANELSLTQVGTFQPNSALGLWQLTNIGGMSFYQCLASREECLFYGL